MSDDGEGRRDAAQGIKMFLKLPQKDLGGWLSWKKLLVREGAAGGWLVCGVSLLRSMQHVMADMHMLRMMMR